MAYPAFTPPTSASALAGPPRGLRTFTPVPATPVVGEAIDPLAPRAVSVDATRFLTSPPAATAAAGGADLWGKVKNLLGQGAQAVKNDPLGALNIGLGAAGAIEYATARAPQLPGKPDVYAPPIRPAQGLNASTLAAGRAQIQAGQRQASRPTTSDAGTTAVQQLFAQAQAGQQQNELSLKDNEAFQADQRRVDEQQAGAYDANYKTQRSYQERVFDLGQRAYEARRQQGAAMSQAALTYFTQARADKLNYQQRGIENAYAAQLGVLPPGLRRPAKPAVAPAPAEEAATLNARGGKLRYAFGRRRGDDKFQSQQGQLTQQAQRAFQESLREASKKRAKGIKS